MEANYIHALSFSVHLKKTFTLFHTHSNPIKFVSLVSRADFTHYYGYKMKKLFHHQPNKKKKNLIINSIFNTRAKCRPAITIS